MNSKTLEKALRDTLPVLSGYVVLGTGFGIIMKASGFGLPWALAMSLFIYAGSMQYAAIGLLTGGASLLTTALTTLAVNARHLFYGVSMLEHYKDTGAAKPYLIFSLTDETYSLVCTGGKERSYYLFVSLFNQLYWVAGTALGSLLGGVLRFNTEGVDFALTALFLTVFTDQWLQNRRHFPALAGVVGSFACLLLFGAERFLLPSMALVTVSLLLYRKGGGGLDA